MFPIYVCDDQFQMPDDPICYIIAKNGVFIKKSTGIVNSLTKVKQISFLEELTQTASIDIPKIPSKLVGHVIGFFRDVYDEYKSEAAVLLYYNQENKQFRIHAPKQTVSAASVNYKPENENGPEGYVLLGTIHSHANMSAFHSGTDVHDEEDFDGLHITFGRMANQNIDMCSSIAINGHRVPIPPDKYLDGIKKVETKRTPTATATPAKTKDDGTVERTIPVKGADGVVRQVKTSTTAPIPPRDAAKYPTAKSTSFMTAGTTMLGWELEDRTGEVTYPKTWMDNVKKHTYTHGKTD